jgi:retron-type reverse transcriptase
VFPSRLKYSQVHLIYKKGERLEVSNYRPISILTPFSKIFEKVIFNRLQAHISDNNILDVDQYGFRKNCSMETATLNLINNILQALNSKKPVGGIFCDLTKAFDSVDHAMLLEKLKFYGVQSKFLKLIASYLNNRYQKVAIEDKSFHNCFSNWE